MIQQPGTKMSKVAMQELQEELLSTRFRETKLTTQLNEARQKQTELEIAVSDACFVIDSAAGSYGQATVQVVLNWFSALPPHPHSAS